MQERDGEYDVEGGHHNPTVPSPDSEQVKSEHLQDDYVNGNTKIPTETDIKRSEKKVDTEV